MKLFYGSVVVLVIVLTQAGSVSAGEIPSFTSCLNPQGEVKASYETGTHGIAGKSGNYQGKDSVYKISPNALTQCFCASNGSGIQTNWLKASDFSESEVKILVSQGWIYIPNGALWGLENAPYLAFNSDFSCKGGGGNGDSGSNSGSGSSGNSGSGSVLGAASGGIGQILGLASTGNTQFLLTILLISLVSLFVGLNLKTRSKKLSK